MPGLELPKGPDVEPSNIEMPEMAAETPEIKAPEVGAGASTHMGETATRQILRALEGADRQLGEETTAEVSSIGDILGPEAAETAQEALGDQRQQEMLRKKVAEAELRRLRKFFI